MLYHVSEQRIRQFTPRIPKNRIDGEDASIKRICFSDSLEGCIGSMPRGTLIAQNLVYLEQEYEVPALLYVYQLDETTIPKENLLSPRKLSVKNLVPDAIPNGEHWVINQPVVAREDIIHICGITTKLSRCKAGRFDGVASLEYEPSLMPNAREMKLLFFSKNSYLLAGRIARKLGCTIIKRKATEKGGWIDMSVPANTSVLPLWYMSRESYWRDVYMSDLAPKFTIRQILGGLDYQKLHNSPA